MQHTTATDSIDNLIETLYRCQRDERQWSGLLCQRDAQTGHLIRPSREDIVEVTNRAHDSERALVRAIDAALPVLDDDQALELCGKLRRVLEQDEPQHDDGMPVEGFLDDLLPPLIARLDVAKARAGRERPLTNTTAAPLSDGLHEPNVLVWNGNRYDVPPIQWRLLHALWEVDSIPEAELTSIVWADDTVQSSTVRAGVSKAGSELMRAGVPWTLNTKAGYVTVTRRT